MSISKNFMVIAAAALMACAPASAASYNVDLTGNPLTSSFGATVSDGVFDDTFNFSITNHSQVTALFSNIALSGVGKPGDIDFSQAWLNDTALNITNGFISLAFTGNPVTLNPGSYALRIIGSSKQSGSYSGNINLSPAPEPGTWAMMIAGFGAVGVSMRRRKTNISFA